MNEQEFDQMLSAQSASADEEKKFQKKVKKAMNRSLYRRITAAILLAVILAVGLILGSSRLTDALFYNPAREEHFLVGDDRKYGEFTLLLEDTISTYFPGKYCWMLGEPERQGFSRYQMDLMISDAYGPSSLSGPANSQFRIAFSHLNPGHAPLYVQACEFNDPSYPYSAPQEDRYCGFTLEGVHQELQDLPESACLDVSMSFETSFTADQMAEILNTSPADHIRWLALEGQNTTLYENSAGGMFVDHIRGEQMREDALKKYPCYFLPQDITGDDLRQCLISRIQLLLDHPDFVSLMESRLDGLISMPRLQERLKNAESHWACYGIRFTGSPSAVEEIMEELSATQVVINNVKLSKYQK